MIDFTLGIYKKLLKTLRLRGYTFIPFIEYLENPGDRVVILRHDVDKRPRNALRMARLENELKVKASYYFRIVEQSFDRDIIEETAELGHEIGYHYEDLTLAKGDMEKAIKLFAKHLAIFKDIYPVKTICMHGSPLSKYDNRQIWQQVDYKDFSIIAEPYFDIDFAEVMYLTDTGRRWDGEQVNVRDKVGRVAPGRPGKKNYHTTGDIVEAAENNLLTGKMMFNIHPQRWDDRIVPWVKELITQNIKNIVKKYFFVKT